MAEASEISKVYSLFIDAMKPLNERMRRELLKLPSETGVPINPKNINKEIGWLRDGEPFFSAVEDLTECFARISYELFPKGDEVTVEEVKPYAGQLVDIMGPLVNEYGKLKRAQFAQEISDGKSVMLVFLETPFKVWLHFFDEFQEFVCNFLEGKKTSGPFLRSIDKGEGKTVITFQLELRPGDPQPLKTWFKRLTEVATEARRSRDLDTKRQGETLQAAALGFLLGRWWG
jgi:hypothetical protein